VTSVEKVISEESCTRTVLLNKQDYQRKTKQ